MRHLSEIIPLKSPSQTQATTDLVKSEDVGNDLNNYLDYGAYANGSHKYKNKISTLLICEYVRWQRNPGPNNATATTKPPSDKHSERQYGRTYRPDP